MGKSKSRNSPNCNNCWMCTKVTQMHEYNNINEMLVEVKKWDLNNSNSFKKIMWSYECLMCRFKTNVFDDWKCHAMSISHLADSHRIGKLCSLVYTSRNYKVVLYGAQNCINAFKKKHPEGNGPSAITILMSEVMRRFLLNLQPLYYCFHCKKLGDAPIHNNNLVTKLKTSLKNYFCESCRVHFQYTNPYMIDCHSLTIEHVTLQCFNHLCSTAKINPKKRKLSELETEQLDQSKETTKLPIVKNKLNITLPTNSLKLPMIVLNKFLNFSKKFSKCNLCGSLVRWNIQSAESHLSNCLYHYDFIDNINPPVYIFECTLCNNSTTNITEYMKHIISKKHIACCHGTKCRYTFFCRECNLLMFSYKSTIISHLLLFHHIQNGEIPMLSIFMANVFKDSNTNPNKSEILHYYGAQDSSALSTVSILCSTCKVEFHTSIDDYNIHMITSEHIILKLMRPVVPLIKENSLATTVKSSPLKSIVVVPSVQKYDSIKVDGIKHKNNALVNKNPIKHEKWTKPLVNEKNLQRLPENNVLPNKSYENAQRSTESNSHVQLTLQHSQQSEQYTKYFKHKIKLLNLLRQYKDRVLSTLSYYCNECDFMHEEKFIWDEHNETKHKSQSTRPTVFCSTCSMLIVGENANDHNGTTEHSILLKLVQSLKPVEEDLIKKTTIMESVENCTSISTETEVNQYMVNIVGSTKGIEECQFPTKNINYNVGSCNIQKASTLNKERLVMKNTLPLKDKDDDQNKYEMNSSISNPVKVKITPTLSYSTNVPPLVLHQTNVEIMKQDTMNCTDISKDKNGRQCEHDMDKKISCDLVKRNEISSTPNSLNVPPTVLHQTNSDGEKHKEINYIDLHMMTYDDINLHKEALNINGKKTIREKVTDDKLQNKVRSISNGTSVPLLTHASKLIKTEQVSAFDEDEAYGKYIIMRLKNLKDKTDMRDIKFKMIDFLKRNLIPEKIDNGTPNNEVPLTFGNMTLSLDPPSSENVDLLNLEDSEYGQYVIQRLRNIKNQKLKQNIKLEIDNIFYTKMRQSLIKS